MAVHSGALTAGQRGVVKVTILPGRDSYAGSDSNGVTSESYQQWPGSYMVEVFDARRSGNPTQLRDVPVMPGGPVHLGGGETSYPDTPSAPPGAAPVYPGLAPGLSVPGPGSPQGEPGSGGGPGLSPPRRPGGTGGSAPAPDDDYQRSGRDSTRQLDSASGAGDLQQLRDRVGQSIETDLVGSTQGRVWGTDIYSDDSSPAAAAVHAGILRDGESGHLRITILPGQDSYQGSDHNGVSSRSWQAWGGSFRIERADKPPQDTSSGTQGK